MSKDRDIDDILESLNQLLREGESHNDDHVESYESPAKVKKALDDLEDELSDASEVEPSRSEALDRDDSETADGAAVSTAESREDISVLEAEMDGVEHWQRDEPEADEPEAESVSDDADEPLKMHRVVLTEKMLVDNLQRSLLSMIGNGASDSELDAESTPIVPQSGPSIDHDLMARLLDHVADDVTRQLPILIKTSLEQHLNDLIQGEPSGDSTDQKEE